MAGEIRPASPLPGDETHSCGLLISTSTSCGGPVASLFNGTAILQEVLPRPASEIACRQLRLRVCGWVVLGVGVEIELT